MGCFEDLVQVVGGEADFVWELLATQPTPVTAASFKGATAGFLSAAVDRVEAFWTGFDLGGVRFLRERVLLSGNTRMFGTFSTGFEDAEEETAEVVAIEVRRR